MMKTVKIYILSLRMMAVSAAIIVSKASIAIVVIATIVKSPIQIEIIMERDSFIEIIFIATACWSILPIIVGDAKFVFFAIIIVMRSRSTVTMVVISWCAGGWLKPRHC